VAETSPIAVAAAADRAGAGSDGVGAAADGAGAATVPWGRRDVVIGLARAAGVTPVVLGVLQGTAEALPRGEETDLAILSGAIALEHQAIALYNQALAAELFPAGLRGYAVEFRGDHLGHRDTQVAITEERGGRPPAPLARYAFGPLRSADQALRKALVVEVAAQSAYAALISRIRAKDYLLSAAFVLVDEVRHMTVWRRVLGISIY
jgi:rubrerythrin